jgi:hypothetical protein
MEHSAAFPESMGQRHIGAGLPVNHLLPASCRVSSRTALSTSTSTSPRADSTQIPGRRPYIAGSPRSTCPGVSHPSAVTPCGPQVQKSRQGPCAWGQGWQDRLEPCPPV